MRPTKPHFYFYGLWYNGITRASKPFGGCSIHPRPAIICRYLLFSANCDTLSFVKECTKCKISKPIDNYSLNKNSIGGRNSICKECRNKDGKKYWNINREKVLEKRKDSYRKNTLKRYNLTIDDFSKILESQDNSCKICKIKDQQWVVDHDHSCCSGITSCGKCIRGILCIKCNWGLGQFGDDVEKLRSATLYLESKNFYGR